MKSFIVLFLLLISNINTAEFNINVGGKGNFKDIINFNDGIERYGIFTSENTLQLTLIFMVQQFVLGIHMKNETEIRNQYIICKGESQDGHTFIRRHTNVKDFSAGVDLLNISKVLVHGKN